MAAAASASQNGLGTPEKKKKDQKKGKKIRNSNNDISLLADQVC